MIAIDRIKKRLHRDIVADPVLHARVLNLYRCGEAYPHAVDDYFPVKHVQCGELASMMRKHMQDEDKHIALYSKAIQKLGAEVTDLPASDVFNHVIRRHTRDPWRVDDSMSKDTKVDRVANFFAHAHWLEKRIARSLEFHHDACAFAADDFPGKVVAAVLTDEQQHVTYTREAVYQLLPRRRANRILNSHRVAERRATLDFSSTQLRRLMSEEGDRWPAARRPFYSACSLLMMGALACG